jgi:hypothetical protein
MGLVISSYIYITGKSYEDKKFRIFKSHNKISEYLKKESSDNIIP